MTNVSPVLSAASGFTAFSGVSGVSGGTASFSKLKISEMDGKDAASIFSSSPDEGQTLKNTLINTDPKLAAQPDNKINDSDTQAAVDQTRQALVQTNPTPDIAQGGINAAVQAYQAIGGFGGGQATGNFAFA